MAALLRFVPWLIDAIKSFFGYFGVKIGAALLVRGAIFVAFVGLSVAFTAGIVALVVALNYVQPNNYFYVGMSLLPDNTVPCVSAYLSAAIMRRVYAEYVRNLTLDAHASML